MSSISDRPPRRSRFRHPEASTPLELVYRAFQNAYFLPMRPGTIEGGDGTLVELNQLFSTERVIPEEAVRYGFAPGETGLCVSWVPADTLSEGEPTAFPTTFRGVVVRYREGGRIVPQPTRPSS